MRSLTAAYLRRVLLPPPPEMTTAQKAAALVEEMNEHLAVNDAEPWRRDRIKAIKQALIDLGNGG
jgi:hypothetical protein